MAKFEVNTDLYLVFRKDVISCRLLSLEARFVLSSIVAQRKKETAVITDAFLAKMYGCEKADIRRAVNELVKQRLITVLFEDEIGNARAFHIEPRKENINKWFYDTYFD